MASIQKGVRRSFTREFKLEVVGYLKKNGGNVSGAARKFNVSNKRVREWRESETKLTEQPRGCRAPGRGRTALYPLMEEALYAEYQQMRPEGKKVKRWWFDKRGKQLLNELYPSANFEFSNHWFRRFRLRHKISYRKETHVSQKAPSSLMSIVSGFHQEIHQVREDGVYELKDSVNMDQTPLPFVLNDGKTYDDTGATEIWCASAASGLDKLQCTVQLTAFADGVSRVRPLVIFRGLGKRIAKKESDAWDSRVKVMFQENAWCSESIMKAWIESEWENVFTNPPTPSSTGKILVLDMHRAQQTDDVKTLLRKHKTTLVSIPAGCTSRIQPLDVTLNKPFKSAVRRQVEEHMQENLSLYTDGGICAFERRILMTKWVANAWHDVCKGKEATVRSCEKCGLSVKLDGSEDDQVHVEGMPNYTYRMEVVEDEEGDDDSDVDDEAEMMDEEDAEN